MVYPIHFTKKFKHAKHYIGFTSLPLEKRIFHHKNGTGSRLMRAVTNAGINWYVSRTWDEDGNFEIKLKQLKNSKMLFPVCNKKLKL